MIELRNLSKKVDQFTAVDSLSMTIGTGEFVGLPGPNDLPRGELPHARRRSLQPGRRRI